MSLLDRLRDQFLPSPVDDALRALIEQAVRQVEPELCRMHAFPQRYARAFRHALAYCQTMAAEVPGPVAINRQAFSHDPVVHAMFGSADAIQETEIKSRAVQEWQRSHALGEVYALLAVRLQEKNILGMEMRGDHVQRDVPQKVVYFSHHTFSELGTSEQEVRMHLVQRFLQSLVERVKERIDHLREEKKRLEQLRDEIQARLRLHRDDADLKAAFASTLATLSEAVAGLDMRVYADYFDEVLLSPEKYLQLSPFSLHLDSMGVCRAPDEGGAARDLQLSGMACRDRRHWTVLLVCCRLDELPPYGARLAEAQRWLSI